MEKQIVIATPQVPLLTPAQASRFYRWSIWARPLLTYALTLCICVMVGTICYLMIDGRSTVTEASTPLITLATIIAPILTAIVIGKSYERGRGVSESEVAGNVVASQNFQPVADDPAAIAEIGQAVDPLKALHSLDLNDYQAKTADDKPEVDAK